MNVLITGIAGHLGSAFAQWLRNSRPDVSIFGIDDLSCGYMGNVPRGISFNDISLGNQRIQGCQDIDYVFHFAAFAALGDHASRQIINVGGGASASINDAALALGKITGVTDRTYLPARHEVFDARSTTKKSEELLGFSESNQGLNGLAEMREWAQEAWEKHPERRDKQIMEFEIEEGVPEVWGKLDPHE